MFASDLDMGDHSPMIDRPKPSQIVIECSPQQKAMFAKAAGKGKLGAWAIEAMTAASQPRPDFPEAHLMSDGESGDLYGVRLIAPRCIVWFDEADDGTLTSRDVMWLDAPPADPMTAARVMREIGDAVAELI